MAMSLEELGTQTLSDFWPMYDTLEHKKIKSLPNPHYLLSSLQML